ncbi:MULTISPECIES: helix-turn-helix domain-containing protein [Clostridium]|uniref:Helix-turn-helix transcriptional regulator n=1 Tax=Clostridium botulinum TaxID=1491 RepID=A0A6G4H479_CLOBO|nr:MULTISPECIES: helix-turn-helix transcriptional regulator [Clostridium]MBY6842221.1 helix-turn-helix transcriptional regulator [Clostridium botulinum]MBY6844465.1 helix-turn-helix transcriptional regulator [Clostridium botulinum]MCW6079293.1 helix-turn-helix domain-containing protein [Clostridium sporogenes]NFH35985.1 helix-turn-helix transcriptional regulator [Clostridium botulinum]NFO72225.1 helix-turn-helix transcriptional regulator [Clostridium botulinum]
MTFKQLRERTNLTVKESSKKLGIKPGTLNKYEVAIRHPSQLVMMKMVQAYKCTHADVMMAYKENLESAVRKFGKTNP